MSVIKTITGMFWAVSIVLATLPLLGYGRYVYEVSSAGARVSMVTTGWPGLPLHQHRGPARHRPRESRLLLAPVLPLLPRAQYHHPPLLHSHHISLQVCFIFRVKINQLEKLEAARSAYLWLPLVFGYLWLPFLIFGYLSWPY